MTRKCAASRLRTTACARARSRSRRTQKSCSRRTPRMLRTRRSRIFRSRPSASSGATLCSRRGGRDRTMKARSGSRTSWPWTAKQSARSNVNRIARDSSAADARFATRSRSPRARRFRVHAERYSIPSSACAGVFVFVPGKTVRVVFTTLVGTSRNAVLDLAEKYHDVTTFERVATLAWTQAQVQLHHLGIEPDEAHLFQMLSGSILYIDRALAGVRRHARATGRRMSPRCGRRGSLAICRSFSWRSTTSMTLESCGSCCARTNIGE